VLGAYLLLSPDDLTAGHSKMQWVVHTILQIDQVKHLQKMKLWLVIAEAVNRRLPSSSCWLCWYVS
jgi:hypothetical protein